MRLHFVPDNETTFTGHIYVKGFFFSSQCHVDYTRSAIDQAFFFHIPYRSDCQVRRERSNDPPGVIYRVTVVVQHHRILVTDNDRAYGVSCFYRDNRDRLEQRVLIGDLPERPLTGADRTPTCSYSVLNGSVDGEAVRFANIGDPLVHRWACDSDSMGMLVHSCSVRDNIGNDFPLVNQRGCVTDEALISPLTYNEQLNIAYMSMRAFKFADQMVVYFTCQVTLCDKRDTGCEGITVNFS
ncbi:Protein CUTL-12 [Aphelenchoides avenae]|nr:Protein CUTL-12 [Aphelenchus avenae]